MFDTLYRPSCLDALRKSYNDSILVGSLIQRLEDNLVSMYALVAAGQSPSQVHRSNLASHREQLVHIKSNLTCLVCLLCSPEHPMACGHSLCDICVQRFGDGMIGFENRFIIHACVICLRQSALVADLKPPTAGVRIVSIDGGGTRGIIPLKTLLELQDLVGADCPIQEFFDLAVGTSAGTSQLYPSTCLRFAYRGFRRAHCSRPIRLSVVHRPLHK